MKKILHISKYYYPFSGGTEQIARDVVLALKGEYEQKIIAFNDGKEDKVDIVDGIEVTKCGCFAKIAAQSLSVSYGKCLHKVMKEFSPDIVVFHYPNPQQPLRSTNVLLQSPKFYCLDLLSLPKYRTHYAF